MLPHATCLPLLPPFPPFPPSPPPPCPRRPQARSQQEGGLTPGQAGQSVRNEQAISKMEVRAVGVEVFKGVEGGCWMGEP